MLHLRGIEALMLRSQPALVATLNSERLHAPVEVAAVDAHQFRSARDVAFSFSQFPLDELAVIGVSRFLE